VRAPCLEYRVVIHAGDMIFFRTFFSADDRTSRRSRGDHPGVTGANEVVVLQSRV